MEVNFTEIKTVKRQIFMIKNLQFKEEFWLTTVSFKITV